MRQRVLLYGATGFSGRLIAAELRDRLDKRGDVQVVLASRDERALSPLAAELGLPWQAFALDTRAEVVSALTGCSIVVNAAGPFRATAERLAKSALDAGCHYVDINGETDVYAQLDDLDDIAQRRGLVLVCGAGETAAATDVLLQSALATLSEDDRKSLGAVRFAVRRARYFSSGSAQTALQSIREQFPVVRADSQGQLHVCHVPGGRLERSFDFGGRLGRRIAVGVGMIDTLVARVTLSRLECVAGSVETYMEMPTALRWLHQAGVWSAGLLSFPGARRLAGRSAALLPDGPDEDERLRNRHTVLLQIENSFHQPIVDWRLETPDPYEFTARSATAVCEAMLARRPERTGWLTPGEVILEAKPDLLGGRVPRYPFEQSSLQQRPCA